MISLFFLKAIQTIFICFYFLFLTGIPCVFYTSLLILMFSKHFKTWSYQFKEHLSMFQTLSEWIHEIFSQELCPQTPDTQLSFNFCFTKNCAQTKPSSWLHHCQYKLFNLEKRILYEFSFSFSWDLFGNLVETSKKLSLKNII